MTLSTHRYSLFSWAIAIAILVGLREPCHGVTLLDQIGEPSTGLGAANVGFENRVDVAQTFTVGVSGKLNRIDLRLKRQSVVTKPLLVDIRKTIAGTPTADDFGTDILASFQLPAASVGQVLNWHPINLPQAVSVTMGDVLAIALRSDDLGQDTVAYWWAFADENIDYGSGHAFGRVGFGAGPWEESNASRDDLAFRTYVDVLNPVPGSSASAPALPTNTQAPFVFQKEIALAGQVIWFDPVIAIGFEYQSLAGATFASVQMPSSVTVPQTQPYQLEIYNGAQFVPTAQLLPGQTHTFGGAGVQRFRILGIDSALALNPENATAFPTGLSFVSNGTVQFSMTPLTIPEPSTALLASVVAALSVTCGRRRRSSHPSPPLLRRSMSPNIELCK